MSKNNDHISKASSVVAKSDDGTIQITFTIPFSEIKVRREEASREIGKNIAIPGFRKGNAPAEKVIETVSQNTLLEKTLTYFLPKIFAEAVEKNNLKPIIYPKFELIKAVDGEDWEVRATTCEAPVIELGDYKNKLKGASAAGKIWTPDSAKAKTDEKTKEKTREEKEQELLRNLLSAVNLKIPKILIDQEVDGRLSSLLSRLEKLGLTLESYLSSTGKTADALRNEYEKQATEGLSLDFILTKIADSENLAVNKDEVDKAASLNEQTKSEEIDEDLNQRKTLIESILRRRKALDYLLFL